MQDKYCLTYQHHSRTICQDSNTSIQKQGTIYCLDSDFRDIAIKEIGEDRLKKLFE